MANSHSGGKVFMQVAAISAKPADATAWGALTWVEIGKVTRMGEVGTKENVLSLDLWSTKFSDKTKGIADGGSPELEVARDSADAGQDGLRAAGLTNLKYAFKIQYDDKLTVGGTGTILYNWGIVGGPRRPQGRNEDFILEIFDLGFVDRELVVDNT